MASNKLSTLAPEYLRAICFLSQKLESLQCLEFAELQNQKVWVQGNMFFFDSSFRSSSIPSLPGWSWNQTRRRISTTLSKYGAAVEFYKLIPRKTAQSQLLKSPSYKLWLYNIKFPNLQYSRSVLWCEKGEETKELHLNDFQFLAEFMPASLAREFWPSNVNKKCIT